MQNSRFPDSLVLIFAMICLALVASWILTPAKYDLLRDADGEVLLEESGDPTRKIDPDSYHTLTREEAPRLPWHSFLTKIPKGMHEAGEIIFFVFLVGGVIGVLKSTGCFDALIGAAIRHANESTFLLVAGMVTLFALGSSTIGMAEEYMPFIPVLVTMCIALKMDALVAVGIVYIGAGIGYGCAALNPFTVIVAQNIADVEPTSGMAYRWILLAACLLVGIHHILRYVHRVQKDESASLVRDIDYSTGYSMPEDTAFTGRRVAVLLVFVSGIVLFTVGVKMWDWYFTELAAVFLGMAIVAALIAGIDPNTVSQKFCAGAAELTSAALLIGFARTIEVVLVDANVIHTIVHGIAETLQGTGASVAAIGMLLVQSVCNFLIPSGSGQAYVTMPIMAPLSDLVGVSRQTAVLAYQFGDGFMNMIVPTNALLMGMLALGRIPYQRWLRFVIPLIIKIYIVAIIALVIAVQIQY